MLTTDNIYLLEADNVLFLCDHFKQIVWGCLSLKDRLPGQGMVFTPGTCTKELSFWLIGPDSCLPHGL